MHEFVSIVGGKEVKFQTDDMDTAFLVAAKMRLPLSIKETVDALAWDGILRLHDLWHEEPPHKIKPEDVGLMCLGLIEWSEYKHRVYNFTPMGKGIVQVIKEVLGLKYIKDHDEAREEVYWRIQKYIEEQET